MYGIQHVSLLVEYQIFNGISEFDLLHGPDMGKLINDLNYRKSM